MSQVILQCDNIQKNYQDGQRTIEVLKSVSFSVLAGESVAILGRSGSGKTTLLNVLGGLEPPSSGVIKLSGQALHELSEKQRGFLRNQVLGLIFQFHHLLPEFTAIENVAMPLLLQPGLSVKEAQNRSITMLERVGLGHRLLHKPAKLSGGERQRVAIARALVTRPKCILADEPTGNLDNDNAQSVYHLMMELCQEQQSSCIVVTHDLSLAKQMDRIITLENGVIVSTAEAAVPLSAI